MVQTLSSWGAGLLGLAVCWYVQAQAAVMWLLGTLAVANILIWPAVLLSIRRPVTRTIGTTADPPLHSFGFHNQRCWESPKHFMDAPSGYSSRLP